MIENEHIGRLQLLLERVQSRASAPRVAGARDASLTRTTEHANVVAVADAAPVAELEPLDFDEAPVSEAPVTPAQTSAAVNPAAFPSDLPPAMTADDESDVEVSSEVVELDIDVDDAERAEVAAADAEGSPMESGAQVVAQPSQPPDELEEVEEVEEPLSPSHDLLANAAAPANEPEEPSPSSSRRPIAAEEPVGAAYEAESEPRHTPPPESGKQVATPSVPPPPSLEGHNLIGGWREPGLAAPLMNPPAHAVAPRVPTLAPAAPSPFVEPQASGTRLTADITEPKLAASSSASVAAFHGVAPVAKPQTLGELLDLTLSL